MMNDKAAAVVSEEQVELAAIALANVHRGHPNPKAYWAWMHEDEQAKFRERATAALQAALGVGGWRPILEAPKDGTYILITDRRHAPCHLIAKWHHGKWWSQPTRSSHSITWDEATDFMLLPPPPASEEG